MSTLTQRPPLDFLRARLRMGIVEQEYIDDATMLTYFSQGYQQACERALCLHKIAAITLTGAQEYALPSDHYRTISVVDPSYGVLDKVPVRTGLIGDRPGYYRVGSTLGLELRPTSGMLLVLYAATPPAFSSFADVPDPSFPPECYYLLAHYVRWMTFRRGGGAGKITQARWEKDQYDRGVQRLRHRSRQVLSVGPQRVLTLEERHPVRYARDVDARR